MNMLARIARLQQPWDLAIIGGGATGAGIAVDAGAVVVVGAVPGGGATPVAPPRWLT